MAPASRILLVEDEDNIALAIDVLLSRQGHEIQRVADGDQALPNIRAQRPDLVILDVTLPGKSGYEICQQMRLDPTLSDLPVLMMSARCSEPEKRKGMAMGANAFLSKPFATDELRSAVSQLIAGGGHEG